MRVRNAAEIAQVSRSTIHKWCRSSPDLYYRSGHSVRINDDVFLDRITNGSGLLTYDQVFAYARALLGNAYITENINGVQSDLKDLAPDELKAEWRIGGRRYIPCVHYHRVERECAFFHEEAAIEHAKLNARLFGPAAGWRGSRA